MLYLKVNFVDNVTPEFPPVAIVGPTSVGKTKIGILAANALGGEIVNADSMQVYRGMDIGTAKPTRIEQTQAVFHLIDVVNPDESWSVSDFQTKSAALSLSLHRSGVLPIFVGGTGLYIRAVTTVLQIPSATPNNVIRKQWSEFAAEHGNLALHSAAAQRDKAGADKIHINDQHRLIRLIEVFEQTGQKLSELHQKNAEMAGECGAIVIGLNYLDRRQLYDRINTRVDTMMQNGFLEEVEALLTAGCRPEFNSFQSLGYRQLASVVRGEMLLSDAVDRIKCETRHFARRQLVWFRADKNVKWINVDGMSEANVAHEVISVLQRNLGIRRNTSAQ